MKYEEALRFFDAQTRAEEYAKITAQTGAFKHYEQWSAAYDEADKIAREAIEKRIPKFVLCPKGYQGIRDTRFYCPSCGKLTRKYEPYCHKCGQAVKYPKEVHDKENRRIVLDWSETE